MKRVFAMLFLAVLAGCASTPKMTDAQRLELFRAHAGAPVKTFSFFGSLNGWTELGDSALAVSTKPNEAYLLELYGPCPDLDFAQAIAVSSQMSQVSAGFDKVTPLVSGGVGRIPCRIQTIRPLDVKALKAAQQEWREAQVVEREADGEAQP